MSAKVGGASLKAGGGLTVSATNLRDLHASATTSTYEDNVNVGTVLAFNAQGVALSNLLSQNRVVLLGNTTGTQRGNKVSAVVDKTVLNVGGDVRIEAVAVPELSASAQNEFT